MFYPVYQAAQFLSLFYIKKIPCYVPTQLSFHESEWNEIKKKKNKNGKRKKKTQ